jgi:apolipoprotein N-acyltransferase
LAAGGLFSAALPPFGWWPAALVGAAVLVLVAEGRDTGGRAAVGAAAGVGLLAPGLWWMTEFSPPGYALAVVIESAFLAAALAATPPGRWFGLGFPAALVLVEAARGAWPFGGVPIATLAQTQVGGPVEVVSRAGGHLAVAAAVAVGGVALAAAARRRGVAAAAAAAVVVAAVAVGGTATQGRVTGEVEVGLVQGGGERGTRASDTSERAVLRRHLDASADLPAGLDLVLWPEDVVDVDGPVDETRAGERLAGLGRQLRSTVVAGVVEGFDDEFRNASVAWGPDGEIVARYDKRQRVPFGEYIPFRSVVRRVADLSDVPRDAATSDDTPILRVAPGDLGVMISYEVFFPRRARDAMSAGAELLLAPTNASSYGTGQMPALELGAARLRALETGRVVLQAAPTGFSAVVDPDGDVRRVTALGEQATLRATVELRTGRTPYTQLGDGPFLVAAAGALAAAWGAARAGRSGPSSPADATVTSPPPAARAGR